MRSSRQNRTDAKSSKIAAKPFWGREIVLEVYPKIQAYIFTRIGPQGGEDVLQNAMEGIIKGMDLAKARERPQFFAWCYRIARNKLNDFFREKRDGRVEFVDLSEIQELIVSETRDEAVPKGFYHDLDLLFGRIRHAKFPCGEMLRNKYLDGMSNKEMAELYDIRVDTLRMRVERCLETAKEIARKLS
jgi:RNA polymerase sigma factor (sigma-70 family)